MTTATLELSSSSAARTRLGALLMALSYEERDVTLSSGQRSTFYIDCKQTSLTGEGHALVGRLLLCALNEAERAHPSRPPFVAVGGLTLGADPLCSALSLTAFLAGRDLPAILVRKEAKGHGTGAFLEGTKSVPPRSRVAVLEDVVTTGGASLTAARRLSEAGYQVDTVFSLVDREAGGREALAKAGLDLVALFDVDALRAAARTAPL